jgi:hypothetical protein
MESVYSLAAPGRAPLSPVGPVWVFLAPGRLAAKRLVYEGWKSLDFLGFSRPNRDFSTGYTEQSEENFFSPLGGRVKNFGMAAHDLACGGAGLFMRQA